MGVPENTAPSLLPLLDKMRGHFQKRDGRIIFRLADP